MCFQNDRVSSLEIIYEQPPEQSEPPSSSDDGHSDDGHSDYGHSDDGHSDYGHPNDGHANNGLPKLGDVPCSYAMLSYASVFLVVILLDKKHDCYANFSIQSIDVYPIEFPSSSSMWRLDFIVKKPSSKCSIFYNRDYVSTKLGSLKTAVLDISHQNRSDGQTDFSVTLAVEAGNITNVHDLDFEIPAMHKQIMPNDLPGHFHVECRNLTIVFRPGSTSGALLAEKKIECHSSFIGLKQFFGATTIN